MNGFMVFTMVAIKGLLWWKFKGFELYHVMVSKSNFFIAIWFIWS